MAQVMTDVRTLKICINGEWRESATDKYMPVTDSSTGTPLREFTCAEMRMMCPRMIPRKR